MSFSRPITLLLFLLLAAFASSAPGLQLHDYQKERHDRFDEGTFPTTPVNNSGLWTPEDFSGIGWSAADKNKGFALISPRHFVGANHFRPDQGSEVVFMNRDGERKTYTYQRFHNIKNDKNEDSDIFIGELAEDIPASDRVTYYAVLDLPEAELVGRDIVVYGRGWPEPRIGRGTIAGFKDSFGVAAPFAPLNDTRNYRFDYAELSAGSDDAYAESGDSGSPSFILFDGFLTVSGTHSAIDDQSSPLGKKVDTYDSFILHYKDQINDHMAATGHQLVLLPEGEFPPAGFEAWREEHFTEAELADESISGAGASAAGDGVTNLMKYALGAPPKMADRSTLPTAEVQTLESGDGPADYLTLIYRQPDTVGDLEYVVEYSPEPSGWSTQAIFVAEEAGDDGATTHTYRAPESVTDGPRAFLRLRVTLDPES